MYIVLICKSNINIRREMKFNVEINKDIYCIGGIIYEYETICI